VRLYPAEEGNTAVSEPWLLALASIQPGPGLGLELD